MWKGPKHYLNLQNIMFVIFFDNSEKKPARKFLFS